MGPAVVFNQKDRPEFYQTLRKRVDQHFKEKQVSKHSNVNMWLKSAFMLTVYFTPLVLMLTGVITTGWMHILMWSIMGFGMSGIGLSIMHDANHGAYSSNLNVNKFFGFVLNFIGGYHVNWKIQHNVLHHTYTNIDGHDEDIEKKGIIRFSPNQGRRKFFKYQLFYAPFLYAILTFYWVTYKDYDQLVRYNRMGLLKGQNISFGQALFRIIAFKVIYYLVTIVAVIVLTDFPWWHVLLGFLLMQMICGMILALVFQSAHVLEDTEFYVPDASNSVENNWAIHQMRTTANFANSNRLLTWLIGGLNYQIEHHLFPTICHVHYPEISKIVRATADEFGIPYLEHRTFAGALKSHFKLLNDLGTGRYDVMKHAID